MERSKITRSESNVSRLAVASVPTHVLSNRPSKKLISSGVAWTAVKRQSEQGYFTMKHLSVWPF